jgi:hypothetical protein
VDTLSVAPHTHTPSHSPTHSQTYSSDGVVGGNSNSNSNSRGDASPISPPRAGAYLASTGSAQRNIGSADSMIATIGSGSHHGTRDEREGMFSHDNHDNDTGLVAVDTTESGNGNGNARKVSRWSASTDARDDESAQIQLVGSRDSQVTRSLGVSLAAGASSVERFVLGASASAAGRSGSQRATDIRRPLLREDEDDASGSPSVSGRTDSETEGALAPAAITGTPRSKTNGSVSTRPAAPAPATIAETENNTDGSDGLCIICFTRVSRDDLSGRSISYVPKQINGQLN